MPSPHLAPARPLICTDIPQTSSPSPSPNPNHSLPTQIRKPTLHLTSYGHRIGPLFPTPHLTFDIRALPNPPKSVRRTGYTGLHKPLRDAFFADERVQYRFQEVCARVCEQLGEHEKASMGAEGQHSEMVGGSGVLRVGVCCEIGRHRSVAFVEELGRVRFEGWNVVVSHRDVDRKSSSSKKSGRSSTSRRDYTDGSY